MSGGKISAFPAGRAMSEIIGSEAGARERLEKGFDLFHEFVPLISPSASQEARVHATQQYLHKGFVFRYYDAYLYHQTDLVTGYGRMLAELNLSGVPVHLDTLVTKVEATEHGYRISGSSRSGPVEFFSRQIVLAVGRYGSELVQRMDSVFHLGGQPNRCDVGVRLEFPSAAWPDIDDCHNDLKLHFGEARTFCVCKDGYLAPYRHGDIFLLEGHSEPEGSSGFTNLAVTLRQPSNAGTVQPALLPDVRQRLLAQTCGKPVRQRLADFLAGRPSQPRAKGRVGEPASISYWDWGSASACFPGEVARAIRDAVNYLTARLIPEDAHSSVYVFAPEMDYYWPRLPVGHDFGSQKAGLYLVGDCSGQFRGILQAFSSGHACAESIAERALVP